MLNERIIEGDAATLGQFPYVVSVIENERHLCGGFIYNIRWIITAASCVVGCVTIEWKSKDKTIV